MNFENILTKIDGRVLIITLNRPNALNALSPAMLGEVVLALNAVKSDDAIGAVLLCGSERAFAAGADIAVMADFSADSARDSKLYVDEIKAIMEFPKPIIAAITGYALGGGLELALCCDIIFTAKSAKLGLPEITLGVIPGMGGTQRLIRAIGKSRASEMIMSGSFIFGEEAARVGIASACFEDEHIWEEALKRTQKIASQPMLALLAAKRTLRAAEEMSLSEGLAYENHQFFELFDSEDQKEGMRAFLEKRKPIFKNR